MFHEDNTKIHVHIMNFQISIYSGSYIIILMGKKNFSFLGRLQKAPKAIVSCEA